MINQKIERKNPLLQELITELKIKAAKENVKLWRRLATDLEKVRKNMRVVNVDTIKKNIRKGEIAVVPGKVIGDSSVENEIAVFQSSASVKKNNKVLSLKDLMNKNPKGKMCRIFG